MTTVADRISQINYLPFGLQDTQMMWNRAKANRTVLCALPVILSVGILELAVKNTVFILINGCIALLKGTSLLIERIRALFASRMAPLSPGLRSPQAQRAAPPVENPNAPRILPLEEMPPSILNSLGIDRRSLAWIPAPFDPTIIAHIAANTQPVIEATQIIEHFDEHFSHLGEWAVLYNDEGLRVTVAQARRDIQNQYLDGIKAGRRAGAGYHKEVAENIELFLKGIIFELRKEDVSLEKKQTALKELASAARHCPPRRHEQALKIYRTLSNQMETLEAIVFQLNQAIKEDLFYDYYSLTREPVMTLNYIRSQVGTELGLDCHPVNLNDPYISLNDARSPQNRTFKHTTPAEFRRIFNEIYTPANVLSIMKQRLNERIAQNNDFAAMISAFIDQEITAHQRNGALTQAAVDKLPAPYQFDLFNEDGTKNPNAYHLTNEGVRFLLVHFGILSSSVPNGHLVPA
jgi:hypothetical protein